MNGKLLELGNIHVHATVMKELDAEKNVRLDFKDLLNAQKVFEYIKTSKQADVTSEKARQLQMQLALSALELQATTGSKKKTSSSSTGGDSGSTKEDRTLTEEQTYERSESSESDLEALLTRAETPSNGPSAPYHELLYATGNSILAGQTMSNLYNFDKMPEGFSLYVIPTIVSFNPQRVTSNDYTGVATLKFTEVTPANREGKASGKSNGLERGNFRIVAVAPSGFTRLVSETVAELRRTSIDVGLAATAGEFGGTSKLAQIAESFDRLIHVLRRPDFIVSITDFNTVQFQYLGYESFKGNTTLVKANFHTEVIAIIKKDVFEEKKGDEKEPTGVRSSQPRPRQRQVQIQAQEPLQAQQPLTKPTAQSASSSYPTGATAPGDVYEGSVTYRFDWYFQPNHKLPWYSRRWDISRYGGESPDRNCPVYYAPQKKIIEIAKTEIFAKLGKLKISGKNLTPKQNDEQLRFDLTVWDPNGKSLVNIKDVTDVTRYRMLSRLADTGASALFPTMPSLDTLLALPQLIHTLPPKCKEVEWGPGFWLIRIDEEKKLDKLKELTLEIEARQSSGDNRLLDHYVYTVPLKASQSTKPMETVEELKFTVTAVVDNAKKLAIRVDWRTRKPDLVITFHVNNKEVPNVKPEKQQGQSDKNTLCSMTAWLFPEVDIPLEKPSAAARSFILTIKDSAGKVLHTGVHEAKW